VSGRASAANLAPAAAPAPQSAPPASTDSGSASAAAPAPKAARCAGDMAARMLLRACSAPRDATTAARSLGHYAGASTSASSCAIDSVKSGAPVVTF